MKWIKKFFIDKSDIQPKLYWVDNCDTAKNSKTEKFTRLEKLRITNLISHPKWKNLDGKNIFHFYWSDDNSYFCINDFIGIKMVFRKCEDDYFYSQFKSKFYKIDSIEGLIQFINDKL